MNIEVTLKGIYIWDEISTSPHHYPVGYANCVIESSPQAQLDTLGEIFTKNSLYTVVSMTWKKQDQSCVEDSIPKDMVLYEHVYVHFIIDDNGEVYKLKGLNHLDYTLLLDRHDCFAKRRLKKEIRSVLYSR